MENGEFMKEILELITDVEGELDNANNCLPEYNANSDTRTSIDGALCSLYVLKEKLEELKREIDLNV